MQKLQTRAARLITCSDPHTSSVFMFKELGWLYLQNRREYYNVEWYINIEMVWPQNIYVICLILMIVCIPRISKILISFEPLNHTLPTITVVSQYMVWTFAIVFLEISKKVLLCQVLKVYYLSVLVINPNFNLMYFIGFRDFNVVNAFKL